jgi:hypothetical protein
LGQHALVFLPSKIKRHEREEKRNAQNDQKTTKDDLVLLGKLERDLFWGIGSFLGF